MPVCRLFCGEHPGTLWPRVNGKIDLKNKMARLSPIEIQLNLLNQTKQHEEFWRSNEQRFREQILAKVPNSMKLNDDGSHLMIMIEVENDDAKINLDTNEHYHVEAYENTGVIIIKIKAETVYGARHALETLSQLIVYDDIRKELQMVGEFEIDDKPVYPHRGFLLDTSRNYFSIDAIKRTIGNIYFYLTKNANNFRYLNILSYVVDGMAMAKMNVFHWHMTDSQSFPLVLKSHPDLSTIGAYSPDKIYTIQDIIDVRLNRM